MKRHSLLIITAAALFCGIGFAFLPRPLDVLESQATALKYSLRGTFPPDSSILITYIDDNAVRAIGWPLKRNFYALLLKTLTDLHVRAVGVEVMFEDANVEYPEYDELLAGVIRSSGAVVLPAYFDGLDREGISAPDSVSAQFVYPGVRGPALRGKNIHLPISSLLSQSAGVGHLNFERECDVPLFVASGAGHVPAFALELLRVACGADRSGVSMEGGRIRVIGRKSQTAFSTESDGSIVLYFPGSINAFPAYPFMEILRSYDALRAGRVPRVPLSSFRDKIVLVGVVAEGRSRFFSTPIESRTPSILLHAAFLDNAMHQRFLTSSPFWATGLLGSLVGIIIGWAVVLLNRRNRWIVGGTAVVLVLAGSQALFSQRSFNLPVAPLLLSGLLAGVTAYLVRQREVRRHVNVLQEEKNRVLIQLRDREEKLEVLEKELLNVRRAQSPGRAAELQEEIRKYRAEIRTLSSRADDMEVFRPDQADPGSPPGEFDGLLYDPNGPVGPVIQFVGKIAGSNAPVLILGESGTGKELIARAIHNRSNRRSGPFVAVNCGALSESLLESELFGHEKGAFTGAVKDRMGRFELAHGGTIFLDEIGEVSEGFQVKLLRVVQEGEIERVGGNRTIKVDVRVVAATHRDLKDRVKLGSFREDLYYRLNVLTVSIPPLRERSMDIPLLVRHFLKREGGELTISRNGMEALLNFRWPGNVRELESAVKRAVLLARAEHRTMITVKDFTEEVISNARQAVAVEEQILDALREKGFSRSSISETAEELGGLSRGTVAEYLRGECLKKFVETRFDRDATATQIALTGDQSVADRVGKKLEEYLHNLAEGVDRSQPWELARTALRPKTKNLPQRYHACLETVAEAYYRGLWTIDTL